MLQLEFSEADKHALNHERYHHPHPRVQQRMEALWLKSQGLPHQRIATLCAISGNTLEEAHAGERAVFFVDAAHFSVTCGVPLGAGSRRPVGGSTSVSWAHSMRSPTT
jgi:hypothetical protein